MNAGAVSTPVDGRPVPTPLAPAPVPAHARALVPVLVRVRVPGTETGITTGSMVTIARVARLAGATGRLVSVSASASASVLPPVVVVVTLGVSPVVGGGVVPLGPSDTRLANSTLRANGQSESVNTRSSYASGGRLLVVLSAVTVAVQGFDYCQVELQFYVYVHLRSVPFFLRAAVGLISPDSGDLNIPSMHPYFLGLICNITRLFCAMPTHRSRQ